jgi:hypothetical protein
VQLAVRDVQNSPKKMHSWSSTLVFLSLCLNRKGVNEPTMTAKKKVIAVMPGSRFLQQYQFEKETDGIKKKIPKHSSAASTPRTWTVYSSVHQIDTL